MPTKYIPKPRPLRPVIMPVGPSIAYVELTKGLHTLIDRDDAEWLGKWNWYASQGGSKTNYYACRVETVEGKQKTLRMHNQILPPVEGSEVDHVHGATLDNRRSQLRHATRQQQNINQIIRKDNALGFKGVRFNKRSGLYETYMRIGGKRRYIGSFATAEEAAAAHWGASVVVHGNFTRRPPHFQISQIEKKL